MMQWGDSKNATLCTQIAFIGGRWLRRRGQTDGQRPSLKRKVAEVLEEGDGMTRRAPIRGSFINALMGLYFSEGTGTSRRMQLIKIII